jgi:adenylate cyclase
MASVKRSLTPLRSTPASRHCAHFRISVQRQTNCCARSGRELGVAVVLTGRLTRRGEALLIQADLIRVWDGSELGGASYARPLSRLPDLQSEVAAEIAGKLRLKLAGAQEKRLTRRYTEGREAYELYLKASAALPPAYSPEALPLLQQARAIDPNFALAICRSPIDT